MNKIRLKVCGLRDNIEEVVSLWPDYAGFIFYEKSSRYVGEDFEMPVLSKEIKRVGVFVNEVSDKVEQLVAKYKLDFAQLHGDESPDYCEKLNKGGIGIIKAFPMDERFDFDQLIEYEAVTDFFLFDTKTEGYGGSGKSFNWDLLNKYSMGKQYFLSGGVSLDNIDELKNLDLNKIESVDVNSKFEIEPGLKNIEKLENLKEKLLALKTKEMNRA